MDGLRNYLGSNFNRVYFELDIWSEQEGSRMSPRFLACAICIVSLNPRKSHMMMILPSFRKPFQNVSSHCLWSYSLSTAEPGFIQVCLNLNSGLLTALHWGMRRKYLTHCKKGSVNNSS